MTTAFDSAASLRPDASARNGDKFQDWLLTRIKELEAEIDRLPLAVNEQFAKACARKDEAKYVFAIYATHYAAPDPRDPDPSRDGIFRNHNCSRCQSGAKPCVQGHPNRCEFPHARND